ncbi:hypothetical protein [Kocuria nitroreducens]|uniref:hypothetical protein n=1 Tax=Kocuria nitroreducens TaxID=3058914 RepID=UPI0036DE2DE0
MTRPAHARPNGPAGESEALRDDVLLDAAHAGDADAFGVLRERYHGTALAVARSRTGSAEEAERIAAAALGRIEQIVGEGGGPRAFLGAFVVWMVGREADGGTRPVALPDDPADPTSLVRVFSGLPAEWQAFLWRTEVLGHSARRVAAALGLGAVAAAGLHRDMVRGLRGLYGQAAGDRAGGPDCAEFSGELPHFVRGTRGQRSRRDVKTHLDGCARCTAEYLSRQDIGTGLRTWTLPVLAGLPLWGTESLELTNLIAAAGAPAGAAAGTRTAAAGAGAAAGAAAVGAGAGASAVGAGAGASGARPDGAAGTSPWSGRRAKVLLGAGALATAVAVAAVGVSGGDDPIPAADSLAAEQAPRTAEDLEAPRADDPAAGAEQEDGGASGAGASASGRDRSSSRSDEVAAGLDPADAPAGAPQGGAAPETAALVADADRDGDDAGAAAADAGGASAGASDPSGGDGVTRPDAGAERPTSVPGGARAAEPGTPGAASTGGAARDTSSGGSSTSPSPARQADASPSAPSPAQAAPTPPPISSVGGSLPSTEATPAPLKAPVPPARTSDPASTGTGHGAGHQHAHQGAGAPRAGRTETAQRDRKEGRGRHHSESWKDTASGAGHTESAQRSSRGDRGSDQSRSWKDTNRSEPDRQKGRDGAPGRSGGSDHSREDRHHR